MGKRGFFVTGSRSLVALGAVTLLGTAYGQTDLEYREWIAFSGDRAGTRQWMQECRTCGETQDFWEAGGVRWHAVEAFMEVMNLGAGSGWD